MAKLAPGLAVGPYIVEQVLKEGRGGYAQVALARQQLQGGVEVRVALKFARTRFDGLDREQTSAMAHSCELALRTEVEILRDLRHPGVVRLYTIRLDRNFRSFVRASELDDRPWYFAMEYLEGGSLEELLGQHRLLELATAVDISQQMASTLDYLHARGITHLDIKASNVLFRQRPSGTCAPQAVLVDFGSAQKVARRADEEGATLAYAPPERVAIMVGKAPPESFGNKPAADIYSLGVVLYRMVTGRMPFAGERSHLTTRILNEPPTRPSQYSPAVRAIPELDNLIIEMLAKDPAARPGAGSVAQRLEEILPAPRLAAARSPNGEHDRGHQGAPAGRAWKVATVAFLSLALVEAGVGIWWIKRPVPNPGDTSQPPAAASTASQDVGPTPTIPPPMTEEATTAALPIAVTMPATEATGTDTPEPTATPAPTLVPPPTAVPPAQQTAAQTSSPTAASSPRPTSSPTRK